MDLGKREDCNRLFDYHKHNLAYINDYIKFADSKAGVTTGANLVLLGFFGNEAKDNGIIPHSIWDCLLLIGLFFLINACYYFVWRVLWPRYDTNTDHYMSWGGIGSFEEEKDYVSRITEVCDRKFIKNMAEQNHSLAKVCVKKYKNLKLGFTLLTIGTIIDTVSWFFDH